MTLLETKFNDIYEANYPKVIRLCIGYVSGDDMRAKDLAQEVFIKVWENLESFRNESSMSTWIYRITVNTCLMSLRQKNTIDVSSHLISIQQESNTANQAVTDHQLTQLYSCINTLSKVNKSIILLELEGLPQKEIAKITGLTHEAIRVRVHRIKNLLTKCVKK